MFLIIISALSERASIEDISRRGCAIIKNLGQPKQLIYRDINDDI